MKIKLEISDRDLAALRATALAWDDLGISHPSQRQVDRCRKVLDKASRSIRDKRRQQRR